MDFEISESHQMFRQTLRKFINHEIVPLVKEAEETEIFPKPLFRKLGDLGYLCPGYPEELGGGGLGKIGECLLIEELCKTNVGIGAAIMGGTGLALYSLWKYGNERQKNDYLIPAIKGRKIAAFSLTEPNAGSDAAAIETTAKKVEGSYFVNGTKIYITNGPICDFIIVTAYTDKSKGTRGISQLIMDRETPGLEINIMHKLGNRSASTAELVFNNCRVPVANLLGEEGRGFKYAMETLNGCRITHGSRSLGVAEAAFEASLDYAKTRVQFGKPIGKNQAIAFKIAKMATDIEAARSLLYRTAWQYDTGDQCRKEGPMTKWFCSEVAIRAAEEAMRIHAGAAYMAESPVGRYFRDAILSHITEGTSEIQQLMIATQLGL